MKKYRLLIVLSLFFVNPAHATSHSLKTIKVFGGEEKSALFESVTATSIKTSAELQSEGKSSLGDAVANLPGVASTGFSASSTRPVIRGLEGERIRILIDELGTLDVSGTSADHVVPINPLLVDSIEVVRGPISLLYGSSAIGGVVNIVSSRQHAEKFEGLSGSMGSQFQSVNNTKNISTKLDYGVSNWVFHFDGNYAHNQNLKVPTDEEKVINSQGEQSSINVGGTNFYNKVDSVNFSYTNYKNEYGAVSEEDVIIDTKQDRIDIFTKNRLNGFFKEISTKTAFSDYEHSELEGGSIGTTFKKKGFENRIDLTQKINGKASGVVGVHTTYADLEVTGDEAFLPSGTDLNTAFFSYQEILNTNGLKLSLGNRFEFVKISPDNIKNTDFFLINTSLGSSYELNSNNKISLNFTYNERNPNSQELFSNGEHIAAGIFESGDASLKKEKAVGLDLSHKYSNKILQTQVNLFANRFDDYIALRNSGVLNGDVFIHNYTPTDALLYGAEVSITKELKYGLTGKVQSDFLVGRDLNNDAYLPRITPPRLSLKLSHTYKGMSSHVKVSHNFEPLNLAPNETNTDSYTLVNIGASKQIRLRSSRLRLYAQIRNLFDTEARNHVSFTKDIMQIGSLNAVIGVEASF